MDITDFTISPYETIKTAMAKIDKNSQGIIYICEDRQLIGVLTDGDIRRYILCSGDLNADVNSIANKNPKYLEKGMYEDIREFMDKNTITSVPIVNQQKEILSIHFLNGDDKKEKKILNLPVVIMAGGKGTRLYPYTQILPKPLIPIGEKTITECIMDRFEEYGCIQFDMIVNYKKNFIKAYFQDNENTRNVSFIEEKEFLGTGGGLKLLSGRYPSTFFMSNCDILVEEDYSDILDYHRQNQNIVTMVCAIKELTIPYGTVDITDSWQALRLNEKPSLSFITNTGFYVIEPAFIDEIPENAFVHITDIIQNCIDKKLKVGVYPVSEDKWLDMGQLDELEKMKRKFES